MKLSKKVSKTKYGCKNSGESIPAHFVNSNKMGLLGRGIKGSIEDIADHFADIGIMVQYN